MVPIYFAFSVSFREQTHDYIIMSIRGKQTDRSRGVFRRGNGSLNPLLLCYTLQTGRDEDVEFSMEKRICGGPDLRRA